MLVEAVTKKCILKEAADKFGVEPEEIDLVYMYNNGKDVEKNLSMREYKKQINAACINMSVYKRYSTDCHAFCIFFLHCNVFQYFGYGSRRRN